MRKFMLMGALVAVVVAALAIPAMAHDGFDNDQKAFRAAFNAAFEDSFEDWEGDSSSNNKSPYEVFYNSFLDHYGDYLGADDAWLEGYNQRWDEDWREDWREDDRNDDEVVPAVSQSFEQRAESGDVNQSFNVSNTGDNSNQCAGIQGMANTGNAQNQVGVIQYGSAAEDFEFEDVGSTITVSPSNSTSCDQRVNQAATASG